MLSRTMETPNSRPRPPAKMRRRSSLAALTLTTSSSSERRLNPITSSPPPAYAEGDDIIVETDSHSFPDTLLGSPVPSTFRFKTLVESPPRADWMDEKSKEELTDLLVKAEDIIKERENELGLTTSVVKSLYENNIALKTKHEAFLARLPLSPPQRHLPISSPEIISQSNSYSSLDSIQDGYDTSPIPPAAPPPPFYRRHARRVSMSTSEVALLADQNSELMHKLELLESESNSADQAGRRDLRRLEKEISSLREALEKTQAKSQELEEKTKGLDKGIDRVVEDAWKRKKERELRIQTLKSAGREETHRARDFAPRGSLMGHFAFSRSMSDLNEFDDEEEHDEDETLTNDKILLAQPEHEIIKQLLHKVQELEDANTRILHQQQETTSQLQAVQRETEQMNKVYDIIGDTQDVDIEIDDLDMDDRHLATNGMDFDHSPRNSVNLNTSRSSRRGKSSRKSVFGPFDGPNQLAASWSDNRHRASYSLDRPGLTSPALSALNFLNSPQDLRLEELSPIGHRQTLDAELGNYLKGGDPWGSHRTGFHMRTHSLSNLSQWSVPPSPSPGSAAVLPAQPLPLVVEPPLPLPSSSMWPGEPCTPEKKVRPSNSAASLHAQDQYQQLHPGGRSPRQQLMSHRIRDRRARWEDERFGSLSSISSAVWDAKPDPVFVAPPNSLRPPLHHGGRGSSPVRIPRRITSIVGSLVDRFDVAAKGSASPILRLRETTPDSESGYEESDEGDYDDTSDGGPEEDSSFEDVQTTDYDEDEEDGEDEDGEDAETEADEAALRTPQIAEDNALQLHQIKPSVSFSSPGGTRPRLSRSIGAQPSGGSGRGLTKQQQQQQRARNAMNGPGKWSNVLLELWLWLQFAVIIFVFLFAMAKRGPKAVLAEAEGRAGTRPRKLSLHAKRH